MFKVEVINYKGELENHLWQNNIEDDFIRFLPNYFGVPKENFTIYKFLDDEALAIRIYQDNENNYVDLSQTGKAIIQRRYKKKYEVNQEVEKADFDLSVNEVAEVFADLTVPTISVPDLQQETDPDTGDVIREYYIIPEGHEFTSDIVQDIKEYVGQKLIRWPYDEEGNFLGNE